MKNNKWILTQNITIKSTQNSTTLDNELESILIYIQKKKENLANRHVYFEHCTNVLQFHLKKIRHCNSLSKPY